MSLTPPQLSVWDTKQLPDGRRANLDCEPPVPFEEIARLIVAEAEVYAAEIERIQRTPTDEFTDARRVVFRIRVRSPTYDLFFNSRDGLRGRYWQSPDGGNLATRYLIELLKPKLLKYAEDNPQQVRCDKRVLKMSAADMRASLAGVSSKIWVHERDEHDRIIIGTDEPHQLVVQRWANENSPTGRQWRWTPYRNDIDIKGALLNAVRVEYIPNCKLGRSYQIHRYGFT